MTLDSLMSTGRVQNVAAANIPKTPNIERNHYADITAQDYYSFNQNYSKGSSGKKSIALIALTLLAFMFFLNILQNCLQDQMTMNQSPQVMVLSSRLKQQKEADKRKDEPQGKPHFTIDDTNESETDEDKTYLKISKRVLESNDKEANNY